MLLISKVNSSNFTKESGELTKFCFYCMDIFNHEFDYIYGFMRIPANEEFPGSKVCHFIMKVNIIVKEKDYDRIILCHIVWGGA